MAPKSVRSLPLVFSSQRYTASNLLKSSPHGYSVRVYSTENSDVLKKTIPAATDELRIPKLPMALTAISLVPFVASAIIPFAFPFEYVHSVF